MIQYTLHTEHIDVTELDEKMLNKKIMVLEKHVKPPYLLGITLQRNTHHRQGRVITCSLNLELNHNQRVFHAERSANTIQDCLDLALSALEQELKKFHDKLRESKRKIRNKE